MAQNNNKYRVVTRKQSGNVSIESLFDSEFNKIYYQENKSKSDIRLDRFIQNLQKSPQLFFRIDQKSSEVRMFSSSVQTTGNEKDSICENTNNDDSGVYVSNNPNSKVIQDLKESKEIAVSFAA